MLARLAAMGGAAPLYVDDVFSAWVRIGSGASATITNGINLSTKGGLVITKARSATTGWRWTDTARGVQTSLDSSATGGNATESTGLTAFNNNGYTIGADADYNDSMGPVTYVDFSFRQADKFFGVATVTKNAGSNATASFSGLGTLGMVTVKSTSTGSWYVWHRSLTAGNLVYLEQTAAEATLGHITVSGTTVTLVNGTIADGPYVVYAWAHDSAVDGIVRCGSFTVSGSASSVYLGWEPQYVMMKRTDATGDWYIFDIARGWTTPGTNGDNYLWANSTAAEATYAGGLGGPRATGFNFENITSTGAYIYLAIRRLNKPPTSGASVFLPSLSVADSSAINNTVRYYDLLIGKSKTTTEAGLVIDRLRGLGSQQPSVVNSTALIFSSTNAEADSSVLRSYWGGGFLDISTSPVDWFFRRAPEVFDVVCWGASGSGENVSHSLGVVPELIIAKKRSASEAWYVWQTSLNAYSTVYLNATDAQSATYAFEFGSGKTSTSFGCGLGTEGSTYVAYLFASKTGISKVGSYTGNGSSQTINCGFSAGARFVLIKRTDNTGDWYVWDSERGIVASTDPHLSLNSTSAEVTTDDSIDPVSSGFIVNQMAATDINVNAATYIFLAFA